MPSPASADSTPSPADTACGRRGPGPGSPRASPGTGRTNRAGPRGADRRSAASRKVTEDTGSPGDGSAVTREVSTSAAWTSCASAHGASASSTSSGAAAPASQAEVHTVKVAEGQG